jgi:hypothetical protein
MHTAQRAIEHGMRRFNVVNCGRRFGKDILAQDRAVFYGLGKASPVGWCAPSYRMLADNYRLLTNTLAPIITRKLNNERIDLLGGGWVDFWSLEQPDRVRGHKYGHVIINEAAMVDNLEEVVSMIIMPTLIDMGGGMDMYSTPKGLNGFYRYWSLAADNPAWSRWHYTTYDNPTIPRSEIDAMIAMLPERVIRQEIMAEFVEDGSFFQKVREAATILKPDVPADHLGHHLVGGLDWAMSEDFTVLTIACRECNRAVDWDRFNQIDYTYQRIRIIDRLKKWGASGAPVLPERNSIGQPNIELLRQAVQVLSGPDNLPGFNTSATTKPMLIQGLASALEHSGFKVPADYADELLSYQVELTTVGHPKFSAPEGQHDDRVISLALVWYAMTRMGVFFA